VARTVPVAVVVVNFNRKDMLADCLDSLLAQTAPPERIVVVDNGSTDGSAEMVAERFAGRAGLVKLDDNLGFAAGNNRGVDGVSSEWIALINNDAMADPAWIEQMMKAASVEPSVGMVACSVIVEDSRDRLDNQGVGLHVDGMSRGVAHFMRAAESVAHQAFIPSGCAALVRRSAFIEAGGFDEGFFCYSEDTDLFIRIRLLGYKCAFAKSAVAYHRSGGGTMGTVSPEKIYYVERNRVSVLLRYYPFSRIVMSPVYTCIRIVGLGIYVAGARLASRDKAGTAGGGTLSMAGAFIRALADAVRRAPEDLETRARWKDRQKAPKGAIDHWLKRHRLDRRSMYALEAE